MAKWRDLQGVPTRHWLVRCLGTSDAWVRCFDHIGQIDISHIASHEQRGRYHNQVLHQSCNHHEHDVHTLTVAFSPSIFMKCSIFSYHQTPTRTPHEWFKKKIHGICHIDINSFGCYQQNQKSQLRSSSTSCDAPEAGTSIAAFCSKWKFAGKT